MERKFLRTEQADCSFPDSSPPYHPLGHPRLSVFVDGGLGLRDSFFGYAVEQSVAAESDAPAYVVECRGSIDCHG